MGGNSAVSVNSLCILLIRSLCILLIRSLLSPYPIAASRARTFALVCLAPDRATHRDVRQPLHVGQLISSLARNTASKGRRLLKRCIRRLILPLLHAPALGERTMVPILGHATVMGGERIRRSLIASAGITSAYHIS